MSPRAPPRSPLQPSSPLSSRNMESLAQQRRQPNRQHGSGAAAESLRLPTLPRFHPANFPSSQTNSTSITPTTGPNSPTAPMSPRTQQRQYSEAQRQLYLYQRELVSNARNTKSTAGNPTSPRLIPLGSPGLSVTPLELEQQQNAGGYFVAGTRAPSSHQGAQADLVENLIREEAKRRGDFSAHMVSQAHSRPVASR